jgi:hypothetical protein
MVLLLGDQLDYVLLAKLVSWPWLARIDCHDNVHSISLYLFVGY